MSTTVHDSAGNGAEPTGGGLEDDVWEDELGDPWWRRIPPLARLAIALVVVALVAGLLAWVLGHRAQDDYWSVVDEHAPVTVREDAVLARLNDGEIRWQAEALTGAKSLQAADWSEVALDVPASARERMVITNLHDPGSVRENGRLLILAPAYRPLVERLLQDDPQVYTDDAAEEERETFKLGGWLAYYSPSGAMGDRTDALEATLGEIARCPYDADPCSG